MSATKAMDADVELTCLFCGSRLRQRALKCRWCGEFLIADASVPDDRLKDMLGRLEAAARLVREELERRADTRMRAGREVPIHVGMTVADAERLLGIATLEAVGGNREEAARILGIGERTIYRKLEDWSYPQSSPDPLP